MTEHKYTDEEVIKLFECLALGELACEKCMCRTIPYPTCKEVLAKQAFDLINRQKAEVAFWMDAAANAKKEAVKEFAERVKAEMNNVARWTMHGDDNEYFIIGKPFIDQIAKEMAEEKT